MFDLVEDKNNLLKDIGVFNCKTNKNGIVRDHMYSRHTGFNNNVFPEILRHPCNCQLLTNKDNVRKALSNSVNSDAITLEELFERITIYKKEWFEQEKVLMLIEKYKACERYNIENYIINYHNLNFIT